MNMNNVSFGAKNPKEKYKEVLAEYSDFLKDDTISFKANNICASIWELADWVWDRKDDLGTFRLSLFEKCPELKIMHDIANSKKHKILSRPKAFIKKAKATGSFSSDFSSDFDNHRLVVVLEDGSQYNLTYILEKTVTFWSEYFNQNPIIYE